MVRRDLVDGLGLFVDVHEAVNVEDDKLDQLGDVAHHGVVLLEYAIVEAARREVLVTYVIQHGALAAWRAACDDLGSHRRRQVVLGGQRLGLVCGVHGAWCRRCSSCCCVLRTLHLCCRQRSVEE